jgi:hypothetical protein
LVAFGDEDVVAFEVLGDQAGGGPGGVQGIERPDHPGGGQSGEQCAGRGAFTAFAGDLALTQDGAAAVIDSGDQEDEPGLGTCSA